MTTVENTPPSRRVAVIEAKAEERRRDADAAVLRHADAAKLQIEVEQQRLQLKEERQEARSARRASRAAERKTRRSARRKACGDLVAKATEAAPAVGRRAMIAVPIGSPMAVAWIGQIGFAEGTLKWPLLGGVVFAAAWELTTAFTGWMYHQARESGDSGTIFRIATWLFAGSAGAMNYWHALDGGVVTDPTPKAVSFGAMSLTGIALWELYTLLIHRKALRDQGRLPAARPRFGIARWTQYPRTTWVARSLSIKRGFTTVDDAWAAALAELDRRARVNAARTAAKRAATRTKAAAKAAAKAGRAPINLTIVRSRTRALTSPIGMWRQPPVLLFSTVGPRVNLMAETHSGSTVASTIEPTPGTTPESTRESMVRTMDRRVVRTTPESTPETTQEATPEPTGESTPETTGETTSESTQRTTRRTTKPRGKGRRRSRDELRVELEQKVAEHYRNGGGEIQVKPLAEQLKATRKTVRELLDEMNVRPIRKAN
jgi:hypothetical protein